MDYLTQEYLQSIYNYNPDTGILTYKAKVSSKATIGEEVGGLDSNGYRCARLHKKLYRVHRLIYLYMTGALPELIDHKDTDKLNNKWNNLRKATKNQNSCNAKRPSHNTTGVKGLSYEIRRGRYVAEIRYKGKRVIRTRQVTLQTDNETIVQELTLWLTTKRKELHNEFSRTN